MKNEENDDAWVRMMLSEECPDSSLSQDSKREYRLRKSVAMGQNCPCLHVT